MGHFMAKLVASIDAPRIGLLNVGQEEIKGDDDIKATAALLESTELLNYIGFVEGNDIVSSRCDVIVTNGFSGNIALKAVEGTAGYFLAALKNILKSRLYFRFLALLLKPVLSRLFKRVGPRQFNGASILGLKGVVIKSHGSADFFAFGKALEMAFRESVADMPNILGKYLISLDKSSLTQGSSLNLTDADKKSSIASKNLDEPADE